MRRSQTGENLKSSSIFTRIGVVCLMAVCICYFGYQLFNIVSEPIKTVNAVHMDLDDTIQTNGIIVRDDAVVVTENRGSREYLLDDGARAKKGDRIALYYEDDATMQSYNEIRSLDEQIENLSYARQGTSDGNDTAKLDTLIAMQLEETAGISASGAVSHIYEPLSELRALIIRRSLPSGSAAGLDETIAELERQKDVISSGISGRMNAVTAPFSGYFSQTVDGLEEVYRASDVTSLTVSEIQNPKDPVESGREDVLGKLSRGFEWYYATTIPAERAEEFAVGSIFYLRFSYAMSSDVKASVYHIGEEEGGFVPVIFRATTINASVLSLRCEQAEIIMHSYSGIKVPKEAVRVVDGQMGVYCLVGMRTRFKPIDILYETDGYFIVAEDDTDTKKLFVYDEIVVKAKELEDKKVVQ